MIGGFRKTVITQTDGAQVALVDLLGPLPDELKPLCHELTSRLSRLNEGTLSGYLGIGELIKREHDIITADSSKSGPDGYGFRFFDRLGAELDIHPDMLRECLKVFECFGAQKYRTLFVDNGATWSHARLLAHVSEPGLRDRLVRQTIADKLSCRELAALVNRKDPKTPRGPGRAPTTPRSLNAGLSRLRSASKTYHAVMRQALFGEKFDIPTEVEDAPPDTLTPETRAVVAECADKLAEIEQIARDARRRLTTSSERIDACIAEQAKQAEQEKAALASKDQVRLDRLLRGRKATSG
jgi:hypothetical protein